MNKLTRPTLSEYLGVELLVNEGQQALREFAATFPTEVSFDPLNPDTLTFSTEDSTFELSCDLDESLLTVYRTRMVTYCPKTTVFEGGWRATIDEAMRDLQIGVANWFQIDDNEGEEEEE